MEVYCNGEWGTICDEGGFGQEEANTICRQLGYTHADDYDHLSLYVYSSSGVPTDEVFGNI